jgi:hypothetical protein
MSVDKRANWISPKVIAYVIGTSALIISGLIAHIFGLITYNEFFIVKFLAVTMGLYLGSSIVVGGGFKRLLNVLAISFAAIIFLDLCSVFLQGFLSFCVSFFVLLVIIRYSLIRDHDSGWFGALCAELMSIIFLLIITLILAMMQMFLF